LISAVVSRRVQLVILLLAISAVLYVLISPYIDELDATHHLHTWPASLFAVVFDFRSCIQLVAAPFLSCEPTPAPAAFAMLRC
jgi:hypothetical protein